jgi:hypothetical protein
MTANFQENNSSKTNAFTKGMTKDPADTYVGEGMWTHARNAVNNSPEGQMGLIGNEPANRFCEFIPYTIIGTVYITDDEWVVFSTNNADSEIGIFDESKCTYTKVANDKCLNFSTFHLITGAIKSNYDCTTSVYWDDGLNPSRFINLDRVPYIKKPPKKLNGQDCVVPEYTNKLDCEALRLAPLITTPCINLSKAKTGGTMPNGSYQVAIAYTINGIKVSDYFLPSNVQSLFSHSDVAGALQVEISQIETDVFEEFDLVIISYVKENFTAHKVGNYSTRTKRILIDRLDPSLAVVQAERIPIRTPSYERSDSMLELNGYLIRTGIYTKPEINYQPQANTIVTKWVAAEFPANYYVRGGSNTSYLRDEVYSFFIRWIYNTGEKSSSYHIPGREGQGSELGFASGKDAIENKIDGAEPAKVWEVKDTSDTISRDKYDIPEGGKVVMEGTMGYWESSESYPDNKPQIWGDLCGKRIRHHKMPDNSRTHIYNPATNSIVLLGVKFENITHPLDINGVPITSIVGYEILRGSREGNKTVIAKGLLSNMGQYNIDPTITTRTGLYQNYPFNDLNVDPFLSLTEVKGGCQGKGYKPMGTFLKDTFSFHSPDTQFRDPFLNPFELKVHGEVWGNATGNFTPAYKHPRHKLLKDFAVFVSAVIGAGVGMTGLQGKKTTTVTKESPKGFNPGISSAGTTVIVSGGATLPPPLGTLGIPSVPTVTGYNNGQFGIGTVTSKTQEQSPFGDVGPMALAAKAFTFTYFFGLGQAEALKTIRLMLPYEQFGYQYDAHGFYDNYSTPVENQRRRLVEDAQYVNPYLQDFGLKYKINNLFRSRYVVIKTTDELNPPAKKDDSRVTIGMLNQWDNPQKGFSRTVSSQYASLKIKMASQYGQLDGILQIPISSCTYNTIPLAKTQFTSPVLFGGDVYINRYTEKNMFPFYNDWLIGEPDGYEYNYLEHVNVPFPRYWINTREYDPTRLMQPFVNTMYGAVIGGAIAGGIAGLFNKSFGERTILGISVTDFTTIAGTLLGGITAGAISLQTFKSQVLPNDYFYLDRQRSECASKIGFGVKNGYFYLFANGVKDFFVESEINLAQRDWGEDLGERHYDTYTFTDIQSLFRSDIIKSGNFYSYDYSLSANRMLGNYVSWGALPSRDFNPEISTSCYSYYSSRAIYSLPTTQELIRDNWKLFLANNYYTFDYDVKTIKAINQSGAMVFYNYASPTFFAGVDQLQTGNGIKVTIGDGGLFATPQQSTSNAEAVYEYGACQSLYGILNTPAGLFWISQDQGKVFQYGGQGGLKEISKSGMKWWFATYLPSQLLKQFPDFELKDNIAVGVASVLTYDNTNEVLYVCKKDYKLKDEYVGLVTYDKDNLFKQGNRIIPLGNPLYFDNASFTISYDVKTEVWLSFHDWHPDFIFSSRKHFMTVKDLGVWKHNDRCDRYSNFYGTDYPFEIEFVASTGKEVTTLKSVEYQVECYKYDSTCQDKNHILDWNFDRALIHNTEQTSGDLKLTLRPKNDPITILDYPIINSDNINILYSKEENKYRFNQFWDVTRNRGEYTENYQTIWKTEPNGYIRTLNPLYTNYNRSELQHKKIRHYLNKILLKRLVSEDVKILFRISDASVTKSFR